MKNKQPSFEITNTIINLMSEISELIGIVTNNNILSNPLLRKVNRIKSIQGSLAIEQNTLSIDEVTALFNGKKY